MLYLSKIYCYKLYKYNYINFFLKYKLIIFLVCNIILYKKKTILKKIFAAFTNSSVGILKSNSWVKRFMDKVVLKDVTEISKNSFFDDDVEKIL